MSHSSVNLLRPTIWMSRADLDRLRAADARESGDTRRDAPASVLHPGASDASDASEREHDVPRCAAVGG